MTVTVMQGERGTDGDNWLLLLLYNWFEGTWERNEQRSLRLRESNCTIKEKHSCI